MSEAYDALKSSLAAGTLWTPVDASASPEPLHIEGPGELPYVAAFSTEAELRGAFEDPEQSGIEMPGSALLAKAIEHGSGLIYDLQLGLSHAACCDLRTALGSGEVEDHPPFDLRDVPDDELLVVDPGRTRAPMSLRRAVHHVLSAARQTIQRAWLVLVCVEVPIDQRELSEVDAAAAEAGDTLVASNLFVVIETDPETIDGDALIKHLGWAAPAGEPIQLVVAHDASPFALGNMRPWPQIFPLIEEMEIN